MSPVIRYNPLRLLNSVPFGIALMVGIGLYIAGGSARPWFRDAGWDQIPGLGVWFDKTDMQFFDAWPLKIMIGLLVGNLVVVTWRRIPLTPPRYGVWCIHSGIITLVLGTAIYYHLKVEGRARMYIDPAMGPTSVSQFYDKDERALYVVMGTDLPQEIDLPDLPRMKAYDETLGNESALKGRGLTGLEPTLQAGKDANKVDAVTNYGLVMGWGHKVTFDIAGYWPYAEVDPDFRRADSGGATGFEVTAAGPGNQVLADQYVIGSDQRTSNMSMMQVNFRHLELPTAAAADMYRKGAEGIFKLKISTTGPTGPTVDMDVQPGGTYTVPGGYVIRVLQYNPSFPTRETGKMVPILMLFVTRPGAESAMDRSFERIVMDGLPKQTDFRLGPDGTPMGMGAKLPLDPNLFISFALNDSMGLLPVVSQADAQAGDGPTLRHTLITVTGQPGFTDIVAGFGQPTEVRDVTDPNGFEEQMDTSPDQAGPFVAAMAAGGADVSGTQHSSVRLQVKRIDNLVPNDTVHVVPKAKRNNNDDESGVKQVVRVRVHFGDYSTDVFVPYSREAYEGASPRSAPDIRWDGGIVRVPGIPVPIRLQLGSRRRDLPAELTLDKFQMVPYPGIGNSILDFRSTVTLTTPETPDGGGGTTMTDIAHSNHPIYYDHGNWLFFQASCDPEGKSWSELGVGNRPAINVMVTGCVMIFVGLMYAFYAKPVIIRRMKQNAIAAAAARKNAPPLPVVDRETTAV